LVRERLLVDGVHQQRQPLLLCVVIVRHFGSRLRRRKVEHAAAGRAAPARRGPAGGGCGARRNDRRRGARSRRQWVGGARGGVAAARARLHHAAGVVLSDEGAPRAAHKLQTAPPRGLGGEGGGCFGGRARSRTDHPPTPYGETRRTSRRTKATHAAHAQRTRHAPTRTRHIPEHFTRGEACAMQQCSHAHTAQQGPMPSCATLQASPGGGT
jgi:hypothetical protein